MAGQVTYSYYDRKALEAIKEDIKDKFPLYDHIVSPEKMEIINRIYRLSPKFSVQSFENFSFYIKLNGLAREVHYHTETDPDFGRPRLSYLKLVF